MTRRDFLEALRQSELFDPAWYRETYPDVDMSGLEPVEHFISVGRILNRDPGPKFDAEFYAETYEIRDPSRNSLIDYLTLPRRESRDCTLSLLTDRMKRLEAETEKTWGALGDGLEISYCIGVMNRLEDIKGTLRANLDANAGYRGKVEFLLILFDEDDESEDWVGAHFQDAMSDGFLRVIRDRETLDTWHFGKAKNAFRPHLRGRYFSSLDGDNFVTGEETDALLKLIAARPNGFVFHHFSGNWGDGTSGRVSIPTSVYRAVGYDPTLLPRQFDEVDIMLGALTRFPALPLICVDPQNNILTLSKNADRYWASEKLANRREFIAYPKRRPPLNQRGPGYQAEVDYLNNMNNFNAALSGLRRAAGPENREQYRKRLTTHKLRFLDSLPRDKTLPLLFETGTASIDPRPLEPWDIPLFACVHDEDAFLPKFVSHYRSLGVTRFFLVDDHSSRPVRDLDLGEGVSVFRPKVGDFKSSKTLWLECLMRLYVDEGGWVVVADADEFLQLPRSHADLDGLRATLMARGQSCAPGLLLDMVPRRIENMAADLPFDELLDAFCFREQPPGENYLNAPPVKWAFGDRGDISWRVDLRFHAFKTIDSLRKFPFFRLRKGVHLNQGFHAFHPTGGGSVPDPEVWEKGPILPIFHYKLARLFSEDRRRAMVEISGGYHGRTAENIKKIFNGSSDRSLQALAAQSAWLRPALEASKVGLFDGIQETD